MNAVNSSAVQRFPSRAKAKVSYSSVQSKYGSLPGSPRRHSAWLEASFFTVVHLSIGTCAIKRRASGLTNGDKRVM